MSLYNDIGLFGFLFTTFELDKPREIVEVFLEELNRIANDLPDGKKSPYNTQRSIFGQLRK